MKAIVYVGLLMLLIGCKSGDSVQQMAEAQQAKELIEQKDFEVSLQWARPLVSNELSQLYASNLMPIDSRAGQINLSGTSNFIRKIGDSLSVYLPYFGTRQMNVNISDTNGAIEFEGIPEDYKIKYNESKQRHQINFGMKEDSEKYNVSIMVYSNRRVQVNINSTYRTSIMYTGSVQQLEGQTEEQVNY